MAVTVTKVRIFPFDLTSVGKQTVAFAEVEIDGVMIIRGIRIHRTPAGGLFISFPRDRSRGTRSASLVEVIDSKTAKEIRDITINAYKETIANKEGAFSPDAEDDRGKSPC